MVLINFISKITNGIDNNAFNISAFVDLSNAFDTIDHTILLQKLSCCGIKGHILSWFKSHLNNRTQHVSYNSVDSKHKTVRCGVP